MSQKLYLNLIKIGVYASLFVVFFVFKGLLFPYITSKQFVFNIIIEILAVLCLGLVIKYPEMRPKKSYVTWGLVAFIGALLASCFVTVDLNLSFWGDVERMLGIYPILHFFALYLVLITAFREELDWKILFNLSVAIAVIEAIMAANSPGLKYGTIGNTAYVSGYLIFNIYFALLLMFKTKNWLLRSLYIAAIVAMLPSFYLAFTYGAIFGLAGSVVLVLALYGILNKDKRLRYATIGSLLVLVLAVSMIFAFKTSAFVQNNAILARVSGISFQKATFKTRLVSWKAAWQDFQSHPVLGVGHGNYAHIFDKYFDPVFYDFTRSETYFDRAHNNLVDIASTTGLVGLITYLSIFVAVGYYLIKGYRENKLDIHEFVLLTGLFAAYFVQNLAVFDSLVTYVGLMMTLAFVYWLVNRKEEKYGFDRAFDNQEIGVLSIAGIAMLVIMYQFTIRPWQMLNLVIDAQRQLGTGQGAEQVYDLYQQAFALETVLDRDGIVTMNRAFANPNVLRSIKDEKLASDIIYYNILMAKKVVDYNPGDSLNQMTYAQVLDAAADYYRSTPDKYAYFSDQALQAIDASIAASPRRIPIYYQKTQILLNRGEKDKAFETMNYAAGLNPKYWDSYCLLGRLHLYYKENDKAYENLDKCVSMGGVDLLPSTSLLRDLLTRYQKSKDTVKVLAIYKQLTVMEPNNINNWIELAKSYRDAKDFDKAKAAALKVSEIDKTKEAYVQDFIEKLK